MSAKLKRIITLIITICLLFTASCGKEKIKEPLRLHIIANSNSPEDQKVKLTVRDKILNEVRGSMPKSKEDAELYVFRHMAELESLVNNTLYQNGFNYSCRIESGVFDFPEKDYSGTVYPAGKYEAVRIILGEGIGENWWCVIFPPLCITSSENTNGEYEWGIVKLFKKLF